jgi:predicted alpha/beta hydrolase
VDVAAAIESPVREELLAVPLPDGARLSLRRFHRGRGDPPVLLLHGAIENGRIFYPRSGHGLAPFLAREGFDAFVADLRGRGRSQPPIGPRSSHGQTESIVEEIPALAREVAQRTGGAPQAWVAHSWGGVLMLACWGRLRHELPEIRAMAFFGSKRSVRVFNRERVIKIDLVWKGLCRALVAAYGYLPARSFRLGSDDETARSWRQSVAWVRPGPFVDPADGFDYGKALAGEALIPTRWYAGALDLSLGHAEDVRRLMREVGASEERLVLLSRSGGAGRDFGHIDMLTHPRALEGHFRDLAAFLRAPT